MKEPEPASGNGDVSPLPWQQAAVAMYATGSPVGRLPRFLTESELSPISSASCLSLQACVKLSLTRVVALGGEGKFLVDALKGVACAHALGEKEARRRQRSLLGIFFHPEGKFGDGF
jgi:hypothetical protein